MGKRVLAAFGVVAPMDGVLASGLSAALTSAESATSSTAGRTKVHIVVDDSKNHDARVDHQGPKAQLLLDTGCPPRPGSRRTPRREAISPTITLHPRNHA